jgi:hypothetical protein
MDHKNTKSNTRSVSFLYGIVGNEYEIYPSIGFETFYQQVYFSTLNHFNNKIILKKIGISERIIF